MKTIGLYFKRNLYFMISFIALILTISFAVIVFIVLDLGKSVAQTSVGFIYLGSHAENQYADVLAPRISQWQKTADYAVRYQEYEWEIDLDYFEFNVTQTISGIKVDVNNPAYFTLSTENEEALYQSLTKDLSPLLISGFNYQQFLIDLTKDLELLKNRKTYELKDYLNPALSQTFINSVTINQIPVIRMAELTEVMGDSFVIPANQRFYLLKALSTYDLSNESLSIIASALSFLLVETPVEGFIFKSYETLPIWASDGMNIRILTVNQFDFSFFNPLKEDLYLSIEQTSDQSLLFTLKGYPFLSTYSRQVVLGPTIHFQTTYIDNPALNELTEGIEIINHATQTIYQLTKTAGVNGFVTYYKRLTIPLYGDSFTSSLFYEQTLPTHAIIEQRIVEKG